MQVTLINIISDDEDPRWFVIPFLLMMVLPPVIWWFKFGRVYVIRITPKEVQLRRWFKWRSLSLESMNVDKLSHNYIFTTQSGEYSMPIQGVGSVSYRRYASRSSGFFETEESAEKKEKQRVFQLMYDVKSSPEATL